jgi:hypothetical protein
MTQRRKGEIYIIIRRRSRGGRCAAIAIVYNSLDSCARESELDNGHTADCQSDDGGGWGSACTEYRERLYLFIDARVAAQRKG